MLFDKLALTAADWSINSFLTNAGAELQKWGGSIMMILGAAAIIAGIYMAVTGLISHGKKQTSWIVVLCLILIGGALIAGGWTFVTDIAKGGKTTIEDLGSGSGATVLYPFLGHFM